jgi:two-component system, cell cycle sensor histidine kinase PleC
MKTEMLGPMGNASYVNYAGDIHESGHHLLKLINEVLDISRIEAGKYELTERPVQLEAVMRDCHRLLRLRADAKGLTIAENITPPQHRLWADERALRQICLNLLSNAIKFTPSGGNIALTVGTTPEGEQFLGVRDDGPGIPESEIPTALSAFGQGKLAQTIAEGGAGLGLPIVQGLVKLHGGSFAFNSRVGQGTDITVRFPRQRVMHPQPSAAVAGEAQAPVRQGQSAASQPVRDSAAVR